MTDQFGFIRILRQSCLSETRQDKLDYQDGLPTRFARGVESLNEFEVTEELVWVLVPSGSIFGDQV
jgi:hypothetical protein